LLVEEVKYFMSHAEAQRRVGKERFLKLSCEHKARRFFVAKVISLIKDG
jgi:hypothetical protein